MLKNKTSLLSLATFAAMLVTAENAIAAQNHQIGVVGLYETANPKAAAFDEGVISKLGCNIRRIGIIGAAQGNIALKQPNQFLFLACDGSILSDATKRKMFSTLNSAGEPLAVLEGSLTDFSDAQRDSSVSGRQYILKISHYNNKNVGKRDRELDDINQEAGKIADTYVTESFIGVNHALGLPTPDEVVILYYDDPKMGDRFRKNNPKLMRKIGKFNKDHLVDAVYYVGQAIK